MGTNLTAHFEHLCAPKRFVYTLSAIITRSQQTSPTSIVTVYDS